MKQLKKILIILFLFNIPIFSIDYTKKNSVKKFISMMHYRYGFKKETLNRWFSDIRKHTHIRYKKRGIHCHNRYINTDATWDKYSYCYLKRVGGGVYFMHKFHNTLKKAYKIYGVEPEYITAVIGIESNYGVNRGEYYVFDRLVHLSFDSDSRRPKFYQKELIALLRLVAKEKINPKDIRGSSSGAIGLAQFMPSTYRAFAVDFNRDGKTQMNNLSDAIASIANYFKKHGWKKGEDVAVRVKYRGNRFDKLATGYTHTYYRSSLKGIEPRDDFNYHGKVSLIKLKRLYYDELWYGGKNFYVITRYNQNSYYAMVVHQLAQKIKKAYKNRYKRF